MDEQPTMIGGGPWQSGQVLPEPSELAAGLQRRMRETSVSQLAPAGFPEEWGGRPKGTSRRAIRMQAEYDKRRDQMIEEAQTLQSMDIQQKQFEMGLRDQQMQEDDFYYNRGIKEAEQKSSAEQLSQATNIISSLNQLDPRSEDYQLQEAKIFSNNPLGAKDEGALKVADRYRAVNNIYLESLATQSEKQKADSEEQAKIDADIVKYELTPEQQAKMLVPNLPTGVVRWDPNKAKPIIAEAEKAIEGRKETKATEKESEARFDDYNKALATYEGMAGAEPEDIAKALAAVRGAAAILRIPKVANENDLQNYNSGDRVLAPDGITVITIP